MLSYYWISRALENEWYKQLREYHLTYEELKDSKEVDDPHPCPRLPELLSLVE